MSLGLVTGHFINNIQAFCNLGENPVLGIDDLTVEVNNAAQGSHFTAGFFKFSTDIPHTCGLSGAGFSINEDIGGGFIPERRGQNRCYFVNLWFTVREDLRAVRVAEDLPVFKYPVISKVFFKKAC
jgi:hypothetical protein